MPLFGRAQRAYEEPEKRPTMVDIKECRQKSRQELAIL